MRDILYFYVLLDLSDPTIFVGDVGFHVEHVCVGIEGVYDILIAILHKGTTNLPRSCQFVVIRVKFFVKVGEFPDLGSIGERPVHLSDGLLHQIVNRGILRQTRDSWYS